MWSAKIIRKYFKILSTSTVFLAGSKVSKVDAFWYVLTRETSETYKTNINKTIFV